MKVKWSKDGKRLVDGVWDETSALACFICPSLKEILKIFGENIMVLKARGGKQIECEKTKLRTLGLTLSKLKDNSCVINYDKSYTQINKCDDFTKDNIKRLVELLDKYCIVDCAVEHLLLKIEDPELKGLIEDNFKIKIKEDVFYAELKLTKCEGDIDRNVWDDTPYNEKVLAPLKFKRSLLHCIKLIDDGQIWAVKKPRRKYYINWKPSKRIKINEDNIPTSPEEIASALMKNFGEYGYIKKYKMNKENKLVLVSMK